MVLINESRAVGVDKCPCRVHHGVVGSRWNGSPPEEAYSRVTDSGRYAGLHETALALLDELEQRFDVTRESSSEPDPHSAEPAPSVRLVPSNPAAASLTIVFDAFPGITVRLGHLERMHLPVCGCDGCDETVEDCTGTLLDRLDALTAGTFGDRLVRDGGWWHEHWYQTSGGTESSSRSRVKGNRLAALRGAMATDELVWAPWPAR